MKNPHLLPRTLLLLTLLALPLLPAAAQEKPALPTGEELTRTITALDTKVFDAYNQCQPETFGSYFTADVEFYHDQGGLTVGRKDLVESIRKYICGKVTRELVPGTLEIYPMKGFGAVEMGVHRFHHPGHDDTEGVGEAKFIHLWQFRDGVWQMTRVISYDHHEVPGSRKASS
jgi:hypothetical protein